jgi:hypothetical protein
VQDTPDDNRRIPTPLLYCPHDLGGSSPTCDVSRCGEGGAENGPGDSCRKEHAHEYARVVSMVVSVPHCTPRYGDST